MIVRGLALMAAWLALWGEVSVANVLSGVLAIGLAALVVPGSRRAAHRVRPIGLLRFAGRLFADLVTSTWTVVVAVIRPTPDRVTAEVMTVPLRTRSTLVATIVANSISLTPGTLTVACDTSDFVLHVHVLGRRDLDEFVSAVAALEERVSAAFTPVGDSDGGAS